MTVQTTLLLVNLVLIQLMFSIGLVVETMRFFSPPPPVLHKREVSAPVVIAVLVAFSITIVLAINAIWTYVP